MSNRQRTVRAAEKARSAAPAEPRIKSAAARLRPAQSRPNQVNAAKPNPAKSGSVKSGAPKSIGKASSAKSDALKSDPVTSASVKASVKSASVKSASVKSSSAKPNPAPPSAASTNEVAKPVAAREAPKGEGHAAQSKPLRARRPSKPTRMKIVWEICSGSGEVVKTYPYAEKAAAEAELLRLSNIKREHVLRNTKVPMD